MRDGMGLFASKAYCGSIPLRLGDVGVCSAGPSLRSLGKLGGGWGFRAVRDGMGLWGSGLLRRGLPAGWIRIPMAGPWL